MKLFYGMFCAAVLAVIGTGCASIGRDAAFLQSGVQRAANQVFPALVYIRVVMDDLGSGRSSASAASGSGVLISASGEIVTNNHVVDKATNIRCQLNDGRAFSAHLIGKDKDTDLALLQLDLPKDTPALPFAEFASRPVQEGDVVMALGAPWGLNRSVSFGIISCANRYLPDHSLYSLWYQTDAAISPGNSGGPLINTDGKIVGINSLGIFGGGTLSFTIPSPTVEIMLSRFRKYGKANWAWFGLQLQPLRDFDKNIDLPYSQGVLVSGIDAGSPAEQAGFEVNDLLLAVNGKAVTAPTAEALPELRRNLGLFAFEEAVKFTVQRDGKTVDLTAKAREKGRVEGSEAACPGWGFTAKAINRFDNPDLYFYVNRGVFVYGVKPRSPAARAGVMKGDILTQINNQPVESLEELERIYAEAAQRAQDDRRTRLAVMRNGVTVQLVVQFDPAESKK